MEPTEILEIAAKDEDSKNQFKRQIDSWDSLTAEIVAFANSGGGNIYVGIVDKIGEIVGVTRNHQREINERLSSVTGDKVRPAIMVATEIIEVVEKMVFVIKVPDGVAKPYMTNKGEIWVKNGADKRRANSREEIQRMFQSAGLLHGDEVPVTGMTVAELDDKYFADFFEKCFEEDLDTQDLGNQQILENMNVMKNQEFNVAGALLFTKKPQTKLPVFMIKAVAYPGNDIHEDSYIESLDIDGKLSEMFSTSLSFLLRQLRRNQNDKNVNSEGDLEIPKVALEEILANALIHRDYFISAPIRIFVFDNRIEIISPGHLPNNLTVEHIKSGNSNIRNPILASYGTKLLPYRGLGNGIRRALKAYPKIHFEDNFAGNLFKVTFER